MYVITKATLKMVNGDKLVLKERVETENIETYREKLQEKYVCKSILFVFEEKTLDPVEEVKSAV